MGEVELAHLIRGEEGGCGAVTRRRLGHDWWCDPGGEKEKRLESCTSGNLSEEKKKKRDRNVGKVVGSTDERRHGRSNLCGVEIRPLSFGRWSVCRAEPCESNQVLLSLI